MGFLTDWLTDWLKSLLIEGILGNLSGLFDTVNARVGDCGRGRNNPGGMERRGLLPHPPDFRNGNFTDCRVSPNLCGGL